MKSTQKRRLASHHLLACTGASGCSLIIILCSHFRLGGGDPLANLLAALLQRQLDTAVHSLAIRAGDLVALARPSDTFALHGLKGWVLPDFFVCVAIHVFQLVGIDVIGNKLGEVSLILCGVFLLEHLHVLLNMTTEDTLLVSLRIVLGVCTLLLSRLESWEVLGAVRHMQSTVCSSLECTPHASTHYSVPDADIQNALERSLVGLLLLNVELLAIDLLLALDRVILAELLQGPACHEKPSAVCCSIVLVSHGNAILRELRRCGLADDLVPRDGGIGHLANNLGVGEAHNEPVLLVVVLVLVLADHLPASLEVSLALATATLGHLVALEVGLVLENLDESHPSQQVPM